MAKPLHKVTLELKDADALELAEFIELNIFFYIRNDTEVDNIRWLCLMTDIYRQLTNGVAEQV